MSLVQYGSSSSSSDETDECDEPSASTTKRITKRVKKSNNIFERMDISDEEEDKKSPEKQIYYPGTDFAEIERVKRIIENKKARVDMIKQRIQEENWDMTESGQFYLPLHTSCGYLHDLTMDDAIMVTPSWVDLPKPASPSSDDSETKENEDDEFLRKKATPVETPPPVKKPVRIIVPSPKEFVDVEEKIEKFSVYPTKSTSTSSSLFSLLPPPKSEQKFVKPRTTKSEPVEQKQETQVQQTPNQVAFIPDAVRNQRPSCSTENIDRCPPTTSKAPSKPKIKVSLVNISDSEESDTDIDFFSLANNDNLPEVSNEEITEMVSRKAAELAESALRFEAMNVSQHQRQEQQPVDEYSASSSSYAQNQLDNEAIQALMGNQAKRRKLTDVEVIDIDINQVQPNREEWLRTALTSATTYQPTGVLTDEEPAAGTRRKHQITYLAHKAKANEAELQAMWSNNRQNRRQTQNKYGF